MCKVADIIAVYNYAAILRTGYVSTDLNGDNFVDVSDIVITFNNVTNVIGVIRS